MMTDLNTKMEINAWCQSYTTAFSAYDTSGISEHWAFPAVIYTPNGPLSLTSRERFDANTEALLGFYKQHGVARAVRELVDDLPFSDNAQAITVDDRMEMADCTVIVRWKAAYVLTRTPDGLKAVFADASGELAAWKARGTPLGS